MIENYVLENNLPLLLFTLPIYVTFKDDLEMRRNTIVLLPMFLFYIKKNMLDKSSAIYIHWMSFTFVSS